MRKQWICTLLLFAWGSVYCVPTETSDPPKVVKPKSKHSTEPKVKNDSYLHPKAKRESWYVSGLVENDSGKQYGYYFAVLREKEQFESFANIIDLKNGRVMLTAKDASAVALGQRLGINLKIQDAFLRYNDINDSWVFGLDKSPGFNLRLESLEHGSYHVSHLENTSFYSLQSKRVNGQLTLDGKNEFVTATNAWLTHQWSDKVNQSFTLQRLMCRLLDGQGLMLVRGYKNNDVVFDLATLLEANGVSRPISQFSLVSQSNPSLWTVSVLSPKMQFHVETSDPQKIVRDTEINYLYPGLVKDKDNKVTGYCLISKESLNPASVTSKAPSSELETGKLIEKIKKE